MVRKFRRTCLLRMEHLAFLQRLSFGFEEHLSGYAYEDSAEDTA
jgi:hypothetical protein